MFYVESATELKHLCSQEMVTKTSAHCIFYPLLELMEDIPIPPLCYGEYFLDIMCSFCRIMQWPVPGVRGN